MLDGAKVNGKNLVANTMVETQYDQGLRSQN
jgi:hypothetical protein